MSRKAKPRLLCVKSLAYKVETSIDFARIGLTKNI